MKSSTLNYITIITNIHIAQSMHINASIPETNTHVKENRKTEEEKTFFSGHHDHVGCSYKFMQ